MNVSDVKYLDIVSNEEINLRSNIAKLKSSFDIFLRLDDLYKLPLTTAIKNETDGVILSLYLLVHSKLYFSISCLLRGHLAEAFAATRGALDASLTAYRIILYPESKGAYLKRDWSYQTIKSTIKSDLAKYPLAAILIELHEMCSQHVSHADISVLNNRVVMHKQEGTEKRLLEFKYFDCPNDEVVYRGVIVDLLRAFHAMLLIFQPFVAEIFSIQPDDWASEIKGIGIIIRNEQINTDKYIKSLK